MQLIKREFCLCLSVTALVFVCALAWGSPFIGSASSHFSLFEHSPLPQTQTQHALSNHAAARQGSGDCFVLGNF